MKILAVKTLIALALAATVAAAALPVVALAVDLFRGSGSGASGGAAAFDERQAGLLLRSLGVAMLSTALALIWGLSTALVVARRGGRLGLAVEALSYLPLAIPNVALVIGWIHILGPAGALAGVLEWATGARSAPSGLFSSWGAGFVLSLCYFPYVTLTCALGLRAMSREAHRAAELAAGVRGRLVRIWLPLMAPYLATGLVLVFLQSFADFGVPSALMVNVYPVEIFAQLNSLQDVRGGFALCLPPLVLAVSLCLVRHLAVRRVPFSTHRHPATQGACPRAARILALFSVGASSVFPLAFLALRAGAPAVYVRAMKMAGEQILASLEVAFWGALLLTSLALLFAVVYRRAGRPARAAAEVGVVALLGFPGAVVGLGVLSLREAGLLEPLGDHAALLAYASACRYFAFPALVLAAALVSLRPRLLEAASVHGAGAARITVRIVLPLLLPALVTAATFSFVLTMAELSASVLVYPPGGMTLPVRLASLLHFGEEPVVAALCVMVSGFVIGLLLLSRLAFPRSLLPAPADGVRTPP